VEIRTHLAARTPWGVRSTFTGIMSSRHITMVIKRITTTTIMGISAISMKVVWSIWLTRLRTGILSGSRSDEVQLRQQQQKRLTYDGSTRSEAWVCLLWFVFFGTIHDMVRGHGRIHSEEEWHGAAKRTSEQRLDLNDCSRIFGCAMTPIGNELVMIVMKWVA